MADMIIEYRIMPESGDIEYSELEGKAKETISSYDSSVEILDVKEHDVGFGLKAVKVKFQIDENKGSEELEEKLKGLDVVGDVIVELMDRL